MLNKKQPDQLESPSNRFIEEIFPIKEVSVESAKEKSNRHGHISTLHIWWARRPLASSRATAYAALIPSSQDKDVVEVDKKDFIIELCKWKNSLNRNVIDRARKDILDANNGIPPKVLDPFAGGGSIPLETLRLGCDTFINEYNPVAVLIQKCMLQYPEKYARGRKETVNGNFQEDFQLLNYNPGENPLIEDIRKWGTWIFGQVKDELAKFYPNDKDGSIPVGYLWARTVPCQNISCCADIPLIRQYWLANKENKRISLYPIVSGNDIKFDIVGTGYGQMPKGFNPAKGTISKGICTCLVCGSVIDNKVTAKLFRELKAGQRIIAVVLHGGKRSRDKKYRVAEEEDVRIFDGVKKYLEDKKIHLTKEWGIDPVPDEPTPEGKGRGAERAFSVRNYGMNRWGELFNSRQNLVLISFANKIREANKLMVSEDYDEDYSRAVSTYLALVLCRIADWNSYLSTWINAAEAVGHTFTRQVLPMIWDYFETNVISGGLSSWQYMIERIIPILSHCSQIYGSSKSTIIQGSATNLPWKENFFDAIFTDPPYYDNVPYSHLSDFFYVWLKRSIGYLYPELFSTPLTPKTMEIVAYSNIAGGWEAGKQFFEKMLKKSFMEINRVLKPNGIVIIVFAHKSTAGWETLLNSLLGSGLVVTAAWPIDTEMKARLRAKDSAALASSIYLVARKLKREKTGFYREVKDQLKNHLYVKLEKLWNEGIAGADLFIAAIGSSIEVYGKYEKVLDDEGNIIRADRFLEIVRAIITDYAVDKILHNGFAMQISRITRFYLLWRWAYGEAKVPYDDALKLSQSVGIDLTHEWSNKDGFVQKDKEFIRVLGPEERQIKEKELGHQESRAIAAKEMIDVLHTALLLWKKGRKEELRKILKETAFGNTDVFYRVAQAISETLPNTSKEKKLLEGFLSGKRKISEESREDSDQTRLFEQE